MQHQARVIGVAQEVAAELRQVAAARLVDVEVLVLEQVDGECLLRRAAQQVEQDEELAVMHADLGDAAPDAKRALPFAERGDDKRRLGAQPLNVKLAVSYITRDAGTHAAELRRTTRPVNAAAMTDL